MALAAAESDRLLLDMQKNVAISREAEPELSIDFKGIENLEIYDEKGSKVRVGDIYANQKTILILVRHFLCYICKEYVDDLADIPESNFIDADVQLVVVGCSAHKFIEPFRKATGYNYKIYVDPDRALYRALHCNVGLGKTVLKDSKHVKSGMISGIFQSMARGMKHCEMQGDFSQQGGAWILGPGDVVSFAHCDGASTDHTAINDLLALAGVAQVNFAKDKRVLSI